MNANEITEADRPGETNDSRYEPAHEAIMEATYRALCAHGVADLTVGAIADEFDKSRSLIFYHYDSKEDVLSSFLAYLLDAFEQGVATTDAKPPGEQLDTLIDGFLFGPDDPESFQTAMLELCSQTPYNEVYREQFRTNDAYIHDAFEGVIERGIEEGVFADADPSRIATMIITTIQGARTRAVVLGDDAVLDTVREVIDEQLEHTLFAERGER